MTTSTLFAVACLAALGCKEPARAVPPPPQETAAEEKFVPAPTPTPVEPAGESPKQTCGQDHPKDDALLYLQTEKLRPILSRVRSSGALPGFLDGVRQAALGKSFSEIPAVIEAAVKEIGRVDDNAPGLQPILERIVRARAGAYATCMGLAQDDISWCTAQDEAWEGERAACQVMHTVHTRIGVEAARSGKDCKDAMAGTEGVIGLTEADWVAMCQAVKDGKPGDCPDSIDQKVATMCKAAAKRDGREPCKAFAEGHSPIWEPCCIKFAYRLSGVIHGKSPGVNLPELGALSGDTLGCERALEWGLFLDSAAHFGVADMPPSPAGENVTDDYLCRFQVYHSEGVLPTE